MIRLPAFAAPAPAASRPRRPRRSGSGLRRTPLLAALLLGLLTVQPGRAQDAATDTGGAASGSETAPLPPLAPGNPFADVPADHWSVAALRRLAASDVLRDVVEPGDPFRGRKALTRYELAIFLARLLEKFEAARRAGQELTREEKIVRDLTREFQGELRLLGVRVDAASARVELQEKRVHTLERRRSNIRMEGFYRAHAHFVNEPTERKNYRFTPSEIPYRHLTERGLTPIEQEIYLRLTGRASPANDLAPGIEAFAEIKGVTRGVQENVLHYQYSDPNAPAPSDAPVVGDRGADSFATGIIDDKQVTLHRAHFVARTPHADVRVFSNEAATEPGDPSRLYSVNPGRSPGIPARSRFPNIRDTDGDPWSRNQLYLRDPFRWVGILPEYTTVRPFQAFSGVEAGGEHGKLTYFGSVLTDFEEIFYPGNEGYEVEELYYGERDPYAAQRTFLPSRTDRVESYNLRLTYEPLRYFQGSGKELLLGLTYNETAYRYDFHDDRNRVAAVDAQYTRRVADYQVDATSQILWSAGRGAREDLAYRLDARYTRGGFLGLFKGYYYGHDFQALTAQDPFVDTDIHHNFLRTEPLVPGPDTRGERLARFQLRYTFDPEELSTLDDLSVETLYEVKAFDRDPLAPRPNDHEPGSRFYLQAIADVDSRIHVEARTEVQKDVPQENESGGLANEEGALLNDVRIDWRPVRKAGLSGELSWIDDFDARDEEGNRFDFYRERLEANFQPSPAIFLKGAFENVQNLDIALLGLPRIPTNGRNMHRFIGEMAFTVSSNFGLKGLVVDQTILNEGTSEQGEVVGGPPPGSPESNTSKIWVGEANWQLSRAFQLRYVYGWQNTDLFESEDAQEDQPGVGDILDDFRNINHYVELRYRPTEQTEVLFTYGDEYESPDDPLDNGPANFHRTSKIYQLTATTNF